MEKPKKKLPVHNEPAAVVVGRCPVCGAAVIDGKEKYWCYHANCNFEINKDVLANYGVSEISGETMGKLLKSGIVQFTGLISPRSGVSFCCQGALYWRSHRRGWLVKLIHSSKHLQEVSRFRKGLKQAARS